jgi:uncharacterized protein (DUF983 family)
MGACATVFAMGIQYRQADPADGPAFFSMMVMAFPATGFALWLDMN